MTVYHYLENKLALFSLKDSKGQRNIAVALVISLLLLLAITGLIQTINTRWSPKAEFISIPFSQYEAELICEDQMKYQMGESLLRSYVDNHSTRFDHTTGMFRIYLKADVGTHDNHKEMMVYCQVNQSNNELGYYKMIDPDKKPFSYADIQFF